nr:ligase-associated DNA damage response endonuclease PdeM [uncultured Sphingorhabdus sp.]
MSRTFEFGGQFFEVAGDAALYWPAQDALLVSDLHLEKASALASGGQMLPPYDSIATLDAVAALCAQFKPATIISLGDNFHDDAGEQRLATAAAALLTRLACDAEWLWISGNHDRDVSGTWGGRVVTEIDIGGVMLRHEALAGAPGPEISGHFHPKFRQTLRGRMVSRRCFVKSPRKLIMPAFGALTGGLDVQHAAIREACDLRHGEQAEAVVPTRDGLARFSLNSAGAFAE